MTHPLKPFYGNPFKRAEYEDKKLEGNIVFGNYIIDFYCPKEKLIIKLDGEIHNQIKKQEYDQKRTKYLESLGFVVILFENKMVFENLPSVLKEIEDNFANNNEK